MTRTVTILARLTFISLKPIAKIQKIEVFLDVTVKLRQKAVVEMNKKSLRKRRGGTMPT